MFFLGTGSDAHHVYQIYLRAGSDEWNIYRRYAQFHALHSDLKKLDPAVAVFDFPPKKSIGKKVDYMRKKRFADKFGFMFFFVGFLAGRG